MWEKENTETSSVQGLELCTKPLHQRNAQNIITSGDNKYLYQMSIYAQKIEIKSEECIICGAWKSIAIVLILAADISFRSETWHLWNHAAGTGVKNTKSFSAFECHMKEPELKGRYRSGRCWKIVQHWKDQSILLHEYFSSGPFI